MNSTAAIAHFRQLCCLGIDSQTAMPSLLPALRRLVGSTNTVFSWADDRGDIVNVYVDQPIPQTVASAFFSQFVNDRANNYSAIGLRNFKQPGRMVYNSAQVFPKTFYRSEMYEMVWQPAQSDKLLWAAVPDNRGRPHGIGLTRMMGDPSFSQRDEQILGQLLPYLMHAVSAPDKGPSELVESGESGLIIVNAIGQVQHQSPESHRLLVLAAHPRLATGHVDWRSDQLISVILTKLRQNLAALMTGNPVPPPGWAQENRWGRFAFRAFPLAPTEDSGNPLVAILIERQVPIQLALMEAMQHLPLSIKQKQVCLLLAEDLSYRAIADRLHIKPNTVIDHVRKIYDKMDVRSHEELRKKLLHQPHGSN